MALIPCPECKKEVSSKATKCPHCGVTLRKLKRSLFGKLVKFSFIIYNLSMAVYMFSLYDRVGYFSGRSSEMPVLVRAIFNAKVNDTLFMWLVGVVILGAFLILTKPKS